MQYGIELYSPHCTVSHRTRSILIAQYGEYSAIRFGKYGAIVYDTVGKYDDMLCGMV